MFKGSRLNEIKERIVQRENKWLIRNLIHAVIETSSDDQPPKPQRFLFNKAKWYIMPNANLKDELDKLKINIGSIQFDSTRDITSGNPPKSSETAFNFRIGIEKRVDGFLTLDRLMIPYSSHDNEEAAKTQKFGNSPNVLSSTFEPFDLLIFKKSV